MATALGLGPQHAAGLLGQARELTSRLAAMLASVEAGTTSMLHARKLAGRTLPIDNEDLVAALAEHVVPLAPTRSAGAFDKLVVATIDRLRDPAEVIEAHQKAARRETGISPMPPMADGMASAVITGPAARIAELFGWCRGFTRLNRDPDDPRTVGQRRFDALMAGIFGATDRLGSSIGDHAPEGTPDREPARARVSLQLVMNVESLLGSTNDPAWLEGHGELAAELARTLAVDPLAIQRLLIQPLTGALLDLSPQSRFPLSGLASFIRARDRICAAPGCGCQARHVDLDHIEEFSKGGVTIRTNLHPLCPRHHRARHAGGWSIKRLADGTEVWTNIHGQSYRSAGTNYRPPPPLPLTPVISADFDVLELPPPPAKDAFIVDRNEQGGGECPI